MYWGAGPALGLLTVLGYIAFSIGVILVWRNRSDFFLWAHDEFGTFRRSLSRYTVVGPFYGRRGESRLKVIPVEFIGSLSRFPRRHANLPFILLFLGAVLFALDFFI
jgi:hypothetical protein